MPPIAADFRTSLRGRFDRATEEGKTWVEVRSGHLHEEVGGYPDSNHRMRNCCRVMRSEMIEGGCGSGRASEGRRSVRCDPLQAAEERIDILKLARERWKSLCSACSTTTSTTSRRLRCMSIRKSDASAYAMTATTPCRGWGAALTRDMWESMKAVSHFNLGTA